MYLGMMNANPIGTKLTNILQDPNYIMENKFDGARYSYRESDFVSKLNVSKGANVPHLIDIFREQNVVLDGEIWYPGKKSNDVMTIMGSAPGVAYAKQLETGFIHYVLYDIMMHKGSELIQLPWSERRKYLEDFYDKLPSDAKEFVALSDVYADKMLFTTYEEILAYVVQHDLEGFMFKNVNKKYVCDKSPEGHWYKFKREVAFEAIITGYHPGSGKYQDQIGSIIFGLYDDQGKLVDCGKCSGMTDPIRKDITQHKMDYLGRIIEVHAMEKITDTSYRHPTFYAFRDDKDPKRCHMHQV